MAESNDEVGLDPAVVDRRNTLLVGIDAEALPQRSMTIAGMEGRLDSAILSKDMSGPATRLVGFSPGWGSGVSGFFTADTEIFVLRGELTLAGRIIGPQEYAFIPAGGVIGGLRARTEGSALLMTAAPLRYDTATGGRPAAIEFATAAAIDWQPQPGHSGRFVKDLRTGQASVWLTGSLEWDHSGGAWHRHAVPEECFVVEGELRVSEWIDGEAIVHTYGAGGYLWRPPGALHAGPESGSPDVALSFHRAPDAPLDTQWVDEPPGVDG